MFPFDDVVMGQRPFEDSKYLRSISNHMLCKVWNEMTYQFANSNDCIVEVWKWISKFTPLIIMDVITYQSWHLIYFF